MVNHITAVGTGRHTEYGTAIFSIYERVSAFTLFPSVINILGDYNQEVDRRVTNLVAQTYPDEFYDGSPQKTNKRILPDYMVADLPSYIGMPPDINEQIIKELLDDYNLFYLHENSFYNLPVQEVW